MREILCCWLALKIEGTMEQGIRPLGVESDPWLTPTSRQDLGPTTRDQKWPKPHGLQREPRAPEENPGQPTT